MFRLKRATAALCFLFLMGTASAADPLRISSAADLNYAMDKIVANYREAKHECSTKTSGAPGHTAAYQHLR